jgi:hypothetical protein
MFVFAAGLYLLGVNKQLDLQTAYIELDSQLARSEDWDQERRLARRDFIKIHKLALLGSIFLAAFVFLRAAIFNHLDYDVGLGLGGGAWLNGLALAEIICFIVASLGVVKIPPR